MHLIRVPVQEHRETIRISVLCCLALTPRLQKTTQLTQKCMELVFPGATSISSEQESMDKWPNSSASVEICEVHAPLRVAQMSEPQLSMAITRLLINTLLAFLPSFCFLLSTPRQTTNTQHSFLRCCFQRNSNEDTENQCLTETQSLPTCNLT